VVATSILVSLGWDVRGVVPAGGGPPPAPGDSLSERAARLGVPTIERDAVTRCGPVDFVISYMYRSLVCAEVRAMARRAAVNFHAGPLPECGGWAFYNVAILEGASTYGCTCHHMDDGFDTGPLVKVRRFPIDSASETAFSLERKAQHEMIRLFVDFCRLADSDAPLPSVPQDPAKMRYLQRSEFEAMKQIPADADKETVQRYARAFWFPPHAGAYREVDGRRVEVTPDGVEAVPPHGLHARDLRDLEAVADECGIEVAA
jgi:methionyl-tRNA formyltransferase